MEELLITNKELLKSDIYFDPNYCKLYCGENDLVSSFSFSKNNQFFSNVSLKCKLPKHLGSGYDASTAYGYGGIVTNIKEKSEAKELVLRYKQFLHQEDIIADFYRFHPFLDTNVLKGHLDMYKEDRKVVYLDLSQGVDYRWSNYTTKTRNIIRKAKKNLEVRESYDLESFLSLYNKTMSKNNASSFYYFKTDYFKKLLSIDGVKLLCVYYEETPVSMGFFFIRNKLAHYHLSANDYRFGKLNGNYLLLDYAADIAFEKGAKYFMLGGGRTSSMDDSLLKFKLKFSPLLKPFYIGGIIASGKKYNEAINKMSEENQIRYKNYFLKYRMEVVH